MAKKKKRGGGYALAMLALVITMIVGFAGMAHAESCTARYFKDYPGRFCLNDEQHYINGAYLGNFISFEGATDDAYQTIFLITEPTADRTITIPDGNVTLSTGTALTTSLADGKVLIGDSGGTAVAVTPSGFFTITNAGVATGVANQVTKTLINDNAVSARTLFTNSENILITSGQSSGAVTLPPGLVDADILRITPLANAAYISNIATGVMNGYTFVANVLTINTTAANLGAVLYKVNYLMPNGQ